MKNIFKVLIIILIAGCGNKELFLSKPVTFQIVSQTDDVINPTTCEYFYESARQKEYLIYLSKDKKTLTYFNLNTKAPEKIIYLDNIPGYIRFFYHKSFDSIFLMNIVDHTSMNLTCIDSSSRILSTWVCNEIAHSKNLYFYTDCSKSYPLFLHNDNVSMKATIREKPSEKMQLEFPLEMEINLKTNHIEKSFGKYSRVYKNNGYYGGCSFDYISRVIGENGKYVYSFPIDHNIQIWNFTDSSYQEVPCKSDYIKLFRHTPKDQYFNVTHEMKNANTAPFYYALYYDKYRNKYYRIVFHELPEYTKDGTINVRYNGSWSIIVLGADFKKEGEIFMNPRSYWMDIVILPEGLLLKRITNDNRINKFDICKITNHEN